jgi:hypothetical protein
VDFKQQPKTTVFFRGMRCRAAWRWHDLLRITSVNLLRSGLSLDLRIHPNYLIWVIPAKEKRDLTLEAVFIHLKTASSI